MCSYIVSWYETDVWFVVNASFSAETVCVSTAVYEQSCEEYKHMGRTSDTYWIDPDGSGPVEPFRVTCDMTGRKQQRREISRVAWVLFCSNKNFYTSQKKTGYHLCVLCVSGDKVWTTLVNDLPPQSVVSAASAPDEKTVINLNYSVSAEQVTFINRVNLKNCEREQRAACRDLLLLFLRHRWTPSRAARRSVNSMWRTRATNHACSTRQVN